MDTLPTHQDQHEMLREEIVQHYRDISQTELSCSIAVGAIYAWLLTNAKDTTHSGAVWFLAPCVVLASGIRCWILAAHLWRIPRYLRLIEKRAFQDSETPGWERYLEGENKQRVTRTSVVVAACGWILALLLTTTSSWYFYKSH